MRIRRLPSGDTDYNPERLTVDDESRVGGGSSTRIVAAGVEPGQTELAAGEKLDDLTGVLDYQFSLYRLQPDVDPESKVVNRHPAPAPGAGAIRPTAPGELSVVSFNMESAMDAFDDPAKPDSPILTPTEVDVKMAKLTLAVADELQCPDVLLVEEIENAMVLTGDVDGERRRQPRGHRRPLDRAGDHVADRPGHHGRLLLPDHRGRRRHAGQAGRRPRLRRPRLLRRQP
jgi:predicted extracellular nuclease